MRKYRFRVGGRATRPPFLEACPIVFGREPREGNSFHGLLDDPYVSREHMRLDSISPDWVTVRNLSAHAGVALADGGELEPGGQRQVKLPTRLGLGDTFIDVEPSDVAPSAAGPAARAASATRSLRVADLGESPEPEDLCRWFESLLVVLQHAAGSTRFDQEAARAVVDLIGLDLGMVLLRDGDAWALAARHPAGPITPEGPEYSQGLLREVLRRRKPVLDKGVVLKPSASLDPVSAVVAAPFFHPADGEVAGVVYGVRTRPCEPDRPAITPLEGLMVEVLGASVGAGRARQAWQSRFEQFTAPELARFLEADPGALDVDTRVVTILACDVRDSSHLAAELGKDYFDLSRDLMGRLTAEIVGQEGMVVDYAGDGILAMWNAPRELPDHPARACRAAIGMIRALPALNAAWSGRIGGRLALGIGLHTGDALVGNAGSRWRVKYGPIGDQVILASRIEGATKHLGVPILLSDATARAVRGTFPTRRLCQVRLVGIAEPVPLHELYPSEPDETWEARRANYELALKWYESGRWTKACQALQQHLGIPAESEDPPDSPSLALLGRVVDCLKTPPRGPFDPAWALGSK